jgi:transposase
MAAPRKYPPELKDRALRLWRSSTPRRPIAHVARELGLNPETLRTWIRQAQADRGERSDQPTTVEIEELRRLRERTSSCAAQARSSRRRAPILPRSSTRPGDGHDVRLRAS